MSARNHIIVNGRVQGVGFRYFVQNEAVAAGITGWVRNTASGAVELEAQGSPRALEPFVEAVARGCFLSRVSQVDRSVIPVVDGDTEFHVRF